MATIEEILTNPPPGVDLTIVGGQALIYWTLSYQQRYPDLFPDEVISSTTDVDFVVQLKEACRECHQYWGGKFFSPGWSATPEFAYILVEGEDDEDPIRIDLMEYIFEIDRNKIKHHRVPVGGDDRYNDMYVLSELGTLLNRVYNTVRLARYTSPEAMVQLHNAIAIVTAAIRWRIEESDVAGAQKLITSVVNLAKLSRYGIRIYLDHGIDLLSVMPGDKAVFSYQFQKHVLGDLVGSVKEKRDRLELDRARRAAERRGP